MAFGEDETYRRRINKLNCILCFCSVCLFFFELRPEIHHETDATFVLLSERVKGTSCYLHAAHPAMILQPAKLEWVSANPPVYQFHELFTHQECDSFWAVGGQPSQQTRSPLADAPVSDERLGTQTW